MIKHEKHDKPDVSLINNFTELKAYYQSAVFNALSDVEKQYDSTNFLPDDDDIEYFATADDVTKIHPALLYQLIDDFCAWEEPHQIADQDLKVSVAFVLAQFCLGLLKVLDEQNLVQEVNSLNQQIKQAERQFWSKFYAFQAQRGTQSHILIIEEFDEAARELHNNLMNQERHLQILEHQRKQIIIQLQNQYESITWDQLLKNWTRRIARMRRY